MDFTLLHHSYFPAFFRKQHLPVQMFSRYHDLPARLHAGVVSHLHVVNAACSYASISAGTCKSMHEFHSVRYYKVLLLSTTPLLPLFVIPSSPGYGDACCSFAIQCMFLSRGHSWRAVG